MASTAIKALSVSALALAITLGAVSCKSDSSSGTGPVTPPPPTPPVVTGAPTAAFIAAASANAFDPVTFDASTSTSADGSALQYVWDFGNGQRGGGKTITRSFGTGGTRSVTLTVFDAANRSASVSKSIAVAAPPAPVATLSVQGIVKALDGTAIAGVTISQVGGSASASTDTAGKARLSLGTGSPLTIRFSKAGYADQLLAVTLPATTGTDAAFDVVMRARDAALTLADAAAGGSLTGRDGALLSLPPNALVTATGTAVTGAVQIAITPVDVTQNGGGGFPGSFSGLAQTGTATPIVSFGTTEYVLTASGQPVQVAPGKSATIELPLYATKRLAGTLLTVGDTTPLWSLDEATGSWVQEGSGTVVASANSPSGLALRASVTHFSWWNSDLGFDPYGPEPKCVYDTNIGIPGGNDTFASATICNMLAQVDPSDGGPTPKLTKGPAGPAAAVLPPRIAGFAYRRALPIAGGVTIPVPANLNVLLQATALNGTWGGTAVVKGPVGARAQVVILMRPLFAAAGPTPEAITLPFDATRSLAALQPTALFTFTGAEAKFARIQLSPAVGSVITGRVRLLQGATVVASATIASSTAQIIAPVSGSLTYTIEIAGDAAAAFRLQADLLGGAQSEPITIPLDITRAIAAYVTFRGTLTVTAPTTIYLARSILGAPADFRVLSAAGAVLLDATGLPDASRGATLTLPAAGAYAVEIRPRIAGSATNVRMTIEQTLWAQIAPSINDAGTSGGLQLVDAQADRNGKLVVAYIELVGSSNRLKLQRWTGAAWESVAADLLIDKPCSASGNMTNVTFDNANAPIVVNSNILPANGSSFVTARRYTGGAWQALGPNNGTLPLIGAFSGACNTFPAIAVGADGAPIAAYQSDNNVVVQRFDGTQWKGLVRADTAGDVFPLQNISYDLKADATGRVWFVTGSPSFAGSNAQVRRFNATIPAWETIGGILPQTNTSGLQTPRLRFTDAGLPVVAWVAGVGTGGVSAPGTAVYRFDGTAWSTTGGYQASGNNLRTNPDDLGAAIVNGEALVSWTNLGFTFGGGVVVQRNTAAGWTPIGTGNGEVRQFTVGAVNDVGSSSSKLVPIGSELYLVLVSTQQVGGTYPNKVVLLRKVAN
jgi:hypothetical protein